MRIAIITTLLALSLHGGTSLTVTGGALGASTSGAPFNNFGSYSFRLEGRFHNLPAGDTQTTCISGLCFNIDTSSHSVSTTTAFTGDVVTGSPVGVAGCCGTTSDALIRIQRDFTGTNCASACYTIEIWDIANNVYVAGSTFAITSSTGNWSGLGSTISPAGPEIAWIEWYTGVVKIGQGTSFCGSAPTGPCVPDVTDSRAGDLASYRFEGALADGSSHAHPFSGAATLGFASTPVYGPQCSPGSQQAFRAGIAGRLSGYGLALDGVTSAVSYVWQQVSGPTVVWNNQRTSSPAISGMVATNSLTGPPSYVFRLTCTDLSGNSTSALIKDGAVATDDDGVIITNTPWVDYHLHQHLRWGSPTNPWPWYDDRVLAAGYAEIQHVYNMAKAPYAQVQNCTSTDYNTCYFQTWWKKFAGGSVALTDGSANVTGAGTNFLTLLNCTAGNAPPGLSMIAVEYTGAPPAPATLHYRMFSVATCTDATHLVLDTPWHMSIGTPTGNYAVDASGAAYQWSLNANANFPANFYDNGVSYLVTYLRTGIDDFLYAWRTWEDEWWEQPTIDQGSCFGWANANGYPGTPWCQGWAWRAHSLLGVILRLLDKGIPPGTGAWTGLEFPIDNSSWAQMVNHFGNAKEGNREAGIQLEELAWGAQYLPGVTLPSVAMTSQQMLDFLLTNDAPYWSDPIYGGIYDGGVGDAASLMTAQQSGPGGEFYTTTADINGTTVTCHDNGGMCDWRFEGTCNTAGTAVVGLSYDGFTKLAAGSTINIGGTNYTIQSITDDTHLSLTSSAGTLNGVAWYQTRYTVSSGAAANGDGTQFWALKNPFHPYSNKGEPLLSSQSATYNAGGDPVSYTICAFTDAHHLQLCTPGQTVSGALWTIMFPNAGWSTAGFYAMPYMEGIAGDALDRVARVLSGLSDSNAATARTAATAAASWNRLYGYQAATKGVWYTRGGTSCPISATPTNSSCDANGQSADAARILNMETSAAIQDDYLANGTPAARTILDTMFNADWAKPGTCAGDPACAPDGTYLDCMDDVTPPAGGAYCMLWGGGYAPWKWYGQFFGMPMAPAWLASRLGGLQPSGITTIYVPFNLASVANATKIAITRTGTDSLSTTTTCTVSPCAVSISRLDNVQGVLLSLQYLNTTGTPLATSSMPVMIR